MKRLYYRDGTLYDRHMACNYNPAKGEASVKQHNGTYRTVYTQERLAQLNKRKVKPKPPIVQALAAAKKERKEFMHEWRDLLSEVQTHANESVTLYNLSIQIKAGLPLNRFEITTAATELKKLKSFYK